MDEVAFGRYRLIELLGRGGMGEVWRAHDTMTDRIVAIKLLPPHLADDDTFGRRFRREAHAAARLDSPHVVPIHNYGEIDGRLYVDMRLIKGRDLQTVLVDGPLPPGRAVRIIEQVAEALQAAHEIGLVHRDVKPSNILLDKNDFAYLIDFGIARATEDTRLTKTGGMIGTLHYLAPERLGTGEVDARADIYALTCVLYECLTGSPPFPGESPERLMIAHLSTPPPQPSTAQPEVPAQFDEVIATGMAKDPDNRYATTVELATAAHDAITTPLAPPGAPTLLGEAPPATPTPAPTLLDPTTPAPPPARRDDPAPPTAATEPAAQQQPADLHIAATQQRPPDRPPVPQPRPADRPPPQIGTPPQRRWWRRQRRGVKSTIIAALIVILAAAGITGYVLWPSSCGNCVALPFTGLKEPLGVAVDTAGNVYVVDDWNQRVLKLAAGSSTQEVLPFTGLGYPNGVAVDTAGALYVSDDKNNRVLKLPAGSNTPTVLPFSGLYEPNGVAVDIAGTLYISDDYNRVLKLPAGSSSQEVLPFTGLNNPNGVAVDSASNIYVVDTGNNRVLKLAAGANTQTVLPFSGLNFGSAYAASVAVDTAGTVYVADYGNNRVLKLAAGSNTPTVLPFRNPQGVAVDTAGNLYVAESGNNRVLKLPAG